jgi:hypothetical protein
MWSSALNGGAGNDPLLEGVLPNDRLVDFDA